MTTTDTLTQRLRELGQGRLIPHAERLPPQAAESMSRQLDALDLDRLPEWVEAYVRAGSAYTPPASLEPAPFYPSDPTDPRRPWDRAAARSEGEALLRAGKVACFTVAGGQGSRLGFAGPKGCFPAGAVSKKPLFQLFAEAVRASSERFGAPLPWYIMTSPLNHEDTRSFFRKNAFFGLPDTDVIFFEQGAMPSLDKDTGALMLAEPGVIATNPDGHGGSIRALHTSGALDDMQRRGVEHISYFQVDNPLVRVADSVFLGLHAAAEDSAGAFSSKMVAKTAPEEKVGVFCLADGRPGVIEYSDLPEELAHQRDDSGALRFLAGNVAIHALGVAFVEKLATDPAFDLPFHRAIKKVPRLDPDTGERVEPEAPNAVKLERFIFDAIPLAQRSIILETDRVEEFAPVKNATGTDSAESSALLQTERAARWLGAAGVSVPHTPEGRPDAVLEIRAETALDAESLASRNDLPTSIEPGAELLL